MNNSFLKRIFHPWARGFASFWNGALGFAVLGASMLFLMLGIFQILPRFMIALCTVGWGIPFLVSSLASLEWMAKHFGTQPRSFFDLSWKSRSLGLFFIFGMVFLTGGSFSPVHGLMYAAAALCLLGLASLPFFLLLGMIFVYEAAFLAQSKQAFHIPFSFALIGIFSSLPWLVSSAQKKQLEKQYQNNLEQALFRIQEAAVSYRLRPKIQVETSIEILSKDWAPMQGSLLVLKQTQTANLQLLQQTLGLHSAVLLWLDTEKQTLCVKEAVCTGQSELETEFPIDWGAFGSIAKNKSPVRLSSIKSSHLPYYKKDTFPASIGSFLGIPLLLSQGTLLGVLCMDRLVDKDSLAPRPFSEEEQAIGEQVSFLFLSHLQSERLFASAERSRDAQERLYQASSQLARAFTLSEVLDMTFVAIEQICPFDFAAITRYDTKEKQHHIVAVRGETIMAGHDGTLEGFSFLDNTSLVSMAIKNQMSLPDLHVSYPEEVPLFDPKIRLRNLPSILVLPLFRGDSPTGTLVIGSQKAQHFGKLQRELLGIIANQVAVSIENALCYQSMETMATIDGLTQIFNRRTWQERCSEMLERAKRHEQPLTLILADIDHFKKINDTHGHLMGDQVLKTVAQVIQSCIRKVDLAARYGGEEFAVVLDRAEGALAFQLADRIRKEVALAQFSCETGTFTCTLSVGFATFPEDGQTLTLLAAHADQALYRAKHQGRNQTIPYASLLHATESFDEQAHRENPPLPMEKKQ